MNVSEPFILRPVGTTLLMAAIMLSGMIAYKFLPLSTLPEVDYPTIQVQTLYPGASPEVMTSSVTAPLERQFGQMPGLNQMTSASSAGASVITLQFGLDLSLDIAEQEVQAAINASGNLLPADLPAPPIYAKVNPADAPILTLAVSSKTLALTDLEDLSETRLAQKISQVTGVGLVSVSGGHRPAVRIQVNPQALAAYGLNVDDIRTTIGNLNVNTPKGNFDGPAQASTINANDQLNSADQYRNLIVAYRNGGPVRLSDVATIVSGPENTKLGAWANTTPAIIVNVQRQPGANIIQVVDRVQSLLPQILSSLPSAVDVHVISDRTVTIRASVADVEFELGLAVVLVVVVIFVFLRTIPGTIIPSLSVPLSLVGTFGAMYLLGFSLDNLSLMALTIATGFVVDDAIVMIENIARFVEGGMDPLEAALRGSEQIGFTIISLTISLIAVLIPLLFMGEVVGRLFHEFAITLAVTIVISAVVSLTLVPMMCAKLIRHRPEAERSRFDVTAERAFNSIIAAYGRALNWVLDRQPLTLLVAVLTLALTVLLYDLVPKGFFPVQDTGMIQGISEASQSISYEAMAELQNKLAEAILKDPDVENLSSFIGVDGTNQTLNTGRFLITLKPHDERSLSAAAIIRRIQGEVSGIIGIALYMQPVQDLTINSTISRAPYHFVLEDANPTEFATWVPQLVQRLSQLPQLTDVASDLQQQGLTVNLVIDRATASRFGITPATVDNALYELVWTAHCFHDLHPVEPVSRHFGARSDATALARRPILAVSAVFVVIDEWPSAAFGHCAYRAANRPIVDYPFRAIPRDDDLVQYRAGLFARRRRQCDPKSRERGRSSRELHNGVSRHCGRLSIVVEQRDFPHHRRRGCDVHRPGRPLRKLHPSDHHPVNSAFGRRRRAPFVDGVSLRSRCHCHHRHHPLDRHREEERDHDDRLRVGSGTRRGIGAA